MCIYIYMILRNSRLLLLVSFWWLLLYLSYNHHSYHVHYDFRCHYCSAMVRATDVYTVRILIIAVVSGIIIIHVSLLLSLYLFLQPLGSCPGRASSRARSRQHRRLFSVLGPANLHGSTYGVVADQDQS